MLSDNELVRAEDVRLNFRELSGRDDLVDADGQDQGADFYLNAGLRYLDDQLPMDFSPARHPIAVAAGIFVANTTRCRAVKDVWLYDHTNDTRVELRKKDICWLRRQYPSDWSDSALTEQGTPLYWAPMPVRLLPALRGLGVASFSTFHDVEDVQFGDHPETHATKSVLLLPPADADYTLTILGAFYSPRLHEQEWSFWLAMYPDAILFAGLMKLNQAHRNREGATDYKLAIDDIIDSVDKNAVEEEIAKIERVENYNA